MFIDTSVFVEILARLAEAEKFARTLEGASSLYTSPLVRLEAVMALSRFNLGSAAENQNAFDAFIQEAGVQIIPIDDETARVAVGAFEKYGRRSGSRAKLNLGDCMNYAVAKQHMLPMLSKGDDFPHTDIELVRFTD